jgi:hypothetical protein
LRSHFLKLRDIHEAVFKHRFAYSAYSLRGAARRHELRLHISNVFFAISTKILGLIEIENSS